MNNIILITDSCCDLPYDFTKENNVVVMPISVIIQEKTFDDDLGQTLKYTDFYKLFRDGEMPKTAQVNVYKFYEEFKKYIENGDKIIYIAFSSALSGTYNSGCIATTMIEEEYKDADISVIDSKSASMGLGLLVFYANKMLKEGKNKAEIVNWLEDNKLKISHWFTVEDLNHLYRGGRVSKTAAAVGSLLNIKPVIHVNNDGKLIPVEKARGRKKSLNIIIDRVISTIIKPEEQVVFISHGDSIEDAEYIKEKLLEQVKVKDIKINYIGPGVGTHSGPGTIAVFYMAQQR